MEGSKQEAAAELSQAADLPPQPGTWGKALAYSETKQHLKTPEEESRFLASMEKSLFDALGADPDATQMEDVRDILRLFLLGETFSFTDGDGAEYVWDVTKAKEIIAVNPREVILFNPSEHGITAEHVLSRYPGLEPERAKTADLTVPVIFIPFAGAHLLIDGWHRLYRAVTEGVDTIPCHLLTEEEAGAILASRKPGGPST